MINDQEYLTTELKKTLEKMIILSAPRLNNLIAMIIGIICSQSVVLSKISQELKDCYSLGTEESKIKRLQRFLSNKAINPEKLYEFFAYKVLQKYKFRSKSIYIIFDHTTIDDRFVILQFSLKVGRRAIPLWFKLFRYKPDGNKDFIYVKEGLKFLHKILTPYGFDVIILADRGFKSVDLFKFIDEVLQWKYCIRCTKDLGISIDGKSKIRKLDDITSTKWSTKHFYNIKLTAQEYICNMAICKAQDAVDVWFIANNLSEPYAIREYKKRFDIEEMFRDFKSIGFNLEDTWTNDIHYAKMLYFCVCISYCYIISLGVSCGKDKKNNLLGAIKNLKGKKVRIYSLFTTGIKWFKRCYYSCRKKYYLKTCFTIYQG
ncbi:transposase [Clostridium botulinum]|uniref:transposase n=1 Tax=Clostridium TaxID=1485 RepID=UPI0013F82E32|nr:MULTISPECIES: transposase [Clostridium]MCS6130346.1 transposase [Clostridium botulinum]NFL45473.1 transposase [Clostridium botulinum]NFL90827.1 transposase [Clostridium botulinum]